MMISGRLLYLALIAGCAMGAVAGEIEDDAKVSLGVTDNRRPDLANTQALRAVPAKEEPNSEEDPNLPKKISSKRDQVRKIPKLPFTFEIQKNGKLRITSVDADGPFARHFKVTQEITWDDINTDKLLKVEHDAALAKEAEEKAKTAKPSPEKK